MASGAGAPETAQAVLDSMTTALIGGAKGLSGVIHVIYFTCYMSTAPNSLSHPPRLHLEIRGLSFLDSTLLHLVIFEQCT